VTSWAPSSWPAIGGSLAGFASADHLAGYAGLAPMPRDSGYRTGNLRRPQRYNPQLQRVFYTSAMISIQRPSLEDLLRRQASPGQAAYPSHDRPRSPTSQRALGHASGPPALPRTTTNARPRPLTSGLRISCRRQTPWIASLHATRSAGKASHVLGQLAL
jgi:hypothetical protein